MMQGEAYGRLRRFNILRVDRGLVGRWASGIRIAPHFIRNAVGVGQYVNIRLNNYTARAWVHTAEQERNRQICIFE
jgi:hypothetical protein